MAVKKEEIAVIPSSTTSYSSQENGVKKPQSSPKSAFERLRRKLLPRKAEAKDLKPSTSKYSSSSDDENCDGPAVCQWNDAEMVFKYLDENGDGKISQEELRKSVRAIGGEMSEEEAEMAVRSSDADGDGMLGLEDFTKLMEGGGEEEKMEELKQAFKMYTMENSELITPKSLKKMLNRLGNSTSIDNCRSMISRFAINGDGVLSFDEFRVMMR
ncbi:calcium-binding CML19 [Olea europaea subsp. europaea]|uniref:Calcium-binding CML19 n=1 Tax=Olea europaea subsp. europaea TaxID=158383 RepID=A0A8S0QAP9_OLEEU|nr:calcium-binding CML19 [Olea europaea subsp. europaea]